MLTWRCKTWSSIQEIVFVRSHRIIYGNFKIAFVKTILSCQIVRDITLQCDLKYKSCWFNCPDPDNEFTRVAIPSETNDSIQIKFFFESNIFYISFSLNSLFINSVHFCIAKIFGIFCMSKRKKWREAIQFEYII